MKILRLLSMTFLFASLSHCSDDQKKKWSDEGLQEVSQQLADTIQGAKALFARYEWSIATMAAGRSCELSDSEYFAIRKACGDIKQLPKE